jgi:hypothetical protein
VSRAPQEHGSPERRLTRGRLWLVLGAALSAAVLAACDGGVTEPPFLPETSPTPADEATFTPAATPTATPTPPETPTPPPESGDLDGFRAFAVQIEAAVESREADFFFQSPVISSEHCGPPVCAEPTTISGVLYGGWDSEASPYPLDFVRASLSTYLNYGAELFAIAETHSERGAVMDGPAAFAIIRAPALETGTIEVLQFVHDDGKWRLRMDLEAGTPEGVTNDWLSGDCDRCYDYWERWEGTAP